MSKSVEPTITLTRKEGYWVAVHQPTNVGAQAESRDEVLSELDKAVALHTNQSTEPHPDEEGVLQDLGIAPDEMPDSVNDADDLPEFLE